MAKTKKTKKPDLKKLQAIAAEFEKRLKDDTLTYEIWRRMIKQVIAGFPYGTSEMLVTGAPPEYLQRFADE